MQFVPSPHLLVTSQFGNQLEATTRGLEVAGHWTPSRPGASTAATRRSMSPTAGGGQPGSVRPRPNDGSATPGQWQLRRRVHRPLAPRWTSRSSTSAGSSSSTVDAYTRADVSAEWRVTRRLSAMAIGQNLFDAAHAEVRRRRLCSVDAGAAQRASACDGRSMMSVLRLRVAPRPARSLALAASSWPRRGPLPPARDVASDVAVKAAFLLQLREVRRVAGTASGASIVVCVVGDEAIARRSPRRSGDRTSAATAGRLGGSDSATWRGLPPAVHRGREIRESAGAIERDQEAAPVLTVSDGKGFARPAASSSSTSKAGGCGSPSTSTRSEQFGTESELTAARARQDCPGVPVQ